MATRPNTTQLFLSQLSSHSESLAGLLALLPMQPISGDANALARQSTRMLLNSTSLLNMTALATLLGEFDVILKTYSEKNAPWDERIAQLTSELIEMEDFAMSNGNGKSATDLTSLVPAEHLTALQEEANAVRSYIDGITEIPADVPEPATEDTTTTEPTAEEESTEADIEYPAVEEESTEAGIEYPTAEKNVASTADPAPMSSTRALQIHTDSLFSRLNNNDAQEANTGTLDELRRNLSLISFHALSIEQMIRFRTPDHSGPVMETVEPVGVALQDFAGMLFTGSDRTIDVVLMGEESEIDSRMLNTVVTILQGMIADVADRCPQDNLSFEVVVQEQYGSLIWSVRDNGTSSITGTLVGSDEYLSFYPSLRDTCRTLAGLHSLLWVEPDKNHQTRFAFTLPVTMEGGGFVVWREDGHRLAVLSNQVSEVVGADEIDILSDERGAYIEREGFRIPMAPLSHLPDDRVSSHVVIVGQVDMRVAFAADGTGELVRATWVKDGISGIKGLNAGVARFDDSDATVLEASDLLAWYVDHIQREQESGDLETESEQLLDDVGNTTSAEETINSREVLIVERSEGLRSELETILSERQLTAKFVDQLDAAVECLQSHDPALIISEFRVPSMAAKVLVEKVRATGKRIPVLVTTAHSGGTATELVEKLGAAGYIAKPLSPADVLEQIDAAIGKQAEAASKP